MNVDAYKKACINKAKPILHCNGKCQMFKKMKKQAGANQANAPIPNFYQNEIVLSTKTYFPKIEFVLIQKRSEYGTYASYWTSNYMSKIFHPPSNLFC